jgi:exosortase A-associated hydrolase 1
MKASREQPLVFRCGQHELIGIVHTPSAVAPTLGVLVVVGGPQYRVGSHRQFTLMARQLAAHGFAVMRFDYRGMGDSEGDVRSFEHIGDDLQAALAAFMAAVPSLRGLVLWGLCDAASALMMNEHDARVRALILVNPWARSETSLAQAQLKHYYGQRLLQRSLWRKIFTAGFDWKRALGDLLRTSAAAAGPRADAAPAASFVERMRRGLGAFRRPVLLLVSEHDLTAQEFMDRAATDDWRRTIAGCNLQVIRLAGADHTFSSRASLDAATEHSRAWLAEQTSTVQESRE